MIARAESGKCTEPYADLEQLGFMGLCRAVERFNPGARVAFSSFAVPYIRGEIQHHLRDKAGQVRLGRRIIESVGRVKRLQRKLEKAGKKMELVTIAQACGISADEWQEMMDAYRCKVISLDAEPIQIAAEDEEIREMKGRAIEGLAYLPAQIRECVIGRFVLRLSDAQIAKQQSIPMERVECLVEQGLQILRQEIATDAAC